MAMWESWKKGGTSEDAFSGTALAVRCYESHPMLKVGKGKLYGGSARFPVKKDADVYVVLQSGDMNGRQSDPWEKQRVIEVQYAIRDMDVPVDVTRFKKLVTWVCNQLHEGKTVHVGCIGGHGRTGTVLSAIVAEALEKEDAIQYVRAHYCKKAVESKDQVRFLMKHYGVSKAEPTKESRRNTGPAPSKWDSQPTERLLFPAAKVETFPEAPKAKRLAPEGMLKATKSYGPMASARSLWKAKKRKS